VPKFNIDRIRQIIGEINSALFKLERCATLSEDEFLSNSDKLDSPSPSCHSLSDA
jgi:hypothetical protein